MYNSCVNFPRKRPVLISGAFAALLLLCFWFLQRLLAPSIDASTPAAQNGYSLLAYNPQEQTHLPPPRNSFERWLQGILEQPTDWYNHSDLMISVPASELSGSPAGYTVLATASTGDTFPLPWSEVVVVNLKRHVEVLVDLPKGYPNAYQWLDVNIEDRQGRMARWRLRKLPRLR